MIDDSEINYRSCINIIIIMLLLLCTNFIFAHCVISEKFQIHENENRLKNYTCIFLFLQKI